MATLEPLLSRMFLVNVLEKKHRHYMIDHNLPSCLKLSLLHSCKLEGDYLKLSKKEITKLYFNTPVSGMIINGLLWKE